MISIIVPIYNAEAYLEECLESIRRQRYSDFEVLMINDGSRDKSKEICEKYAEADKRYVLIDKKNEGVCVARNTGLKRARGEYIAFVDSDDSIHEEFLLKLHAALIENDAEVAFCDFITDSKRWNPDWKNEVFCGEAIFSNHLRGGCGNRIMNKLYRRSTIGDICFPVDREIMEDAEWTALVLNNCKKVVSISEALYSYRIVGNSLSHKKFTEREEVGCFCNMLSRTSVIADHVSAKEDLEMLAQELNEIIVHMFRSRDDLNMFDAYSMLRKQAVRRCFDEHCSAGICIVRKYANYKVARNRYFWYAMRSPKHSFVDKLKFCNRIIRRWGC